MKIHQRLEVYGPDNMKFISIVEWNVIILLGLLDPLTQLTH